MPSETWLRVTDDAGNFLFETKQFLEIGEAPGLRYVLACGKVGALITTIPPEFNTLLPKDGRIHVMRSVNGGPAQREGESCYLIRKWQYTDDYTIVTALHANQLFWRRYAFFGWHTRGQETSSGVTADDTIKDDIWEKNFGFNASSGGVGREAGNSFTQADISAYVTTEAFKGAAPVIFKQWYWQSVGDTILEMCDASFLNGTYLAAEIVAPTESTLELRTYTGQRGQDLRFSTGSGLLFTANRGNFANAILTVDATEEITVAVAGGPTRDSGTSIRASEDLTRMGESVFGRIEAFVDDASGTNIDINMIQGDADAAVRGGRPVITATGDLVETDTCARGVHFNFGDLITVEVRGIQYDMRIDLLDIALSGGVETTKAGFYYNG